MEFKKARGGHPPEIRIESCTSGKAGGLNCEPLKAVWPDYAGMLPIRTSSVDRADDLLSLALGCTGALASRPAHRRHVIPSRPKDPTKVFFRSINLRVIAIALFPLIYPTTPDTEYFGGIVNIMCTWSPSDAPPSPPLCWANSLIIDPSSLRIDPYITLRRYFGMNIT